MTIADLTEGDTFTITQPGHKFEGRTLTVKSLGSAGRTLCATDTDRGGRVFLVRSADTVTVV